MVPAINRCGIFARSATYGMPSMSLPRHIASLLCDFWNASCSTNSRRTTVSRCLFGTSMPTTPLPGMGATMRTRSASIAIARSSASPAMRLTLIPAAGRNSNIVTTGPGRICVTCPWIPKEASFWRSFSAVAVNPSRSSGTAWDASPVRMLIGGGTNELCPGAMVKPEPAAFASDEAAAFGLGGALGSTISGSGSCPNRATPADPAGGGSDRTGRDAPGGRETLFRRPSSNGSRGSWGGSSAAATARPSAAWRGVCRRGSTMRASSPAHRSASSPNETVRAFAIAAAAPRTASAPPATPSFAAPRAACSAHRSVATTSAAPPTAQSSTAAPGTDSADRAARESIAPTAPPAGWPWRRACAVRSSRPMAHSENVNQDPARPNDSRGRPTTSAQATARKKIAIA